MNIYKHRSKLINRRKTSRFDNAFLAIKEQERLVGGWRGMGRTRVMGGEKGDGGERVMESRIIGGRWGTGGMEEGGRWRRVEWRRVE